MALNGHVEAGAARENRPSRARTATPIGPYSSLLDTIDGENSSLLKTPSPVRPIAVNTAVGRSCRHGSPPSVSSRPLTQMNRTNPAKIRTP